MTDDSEDGLHKFITMYCDIVLDGFHDRWNKYTPEIYHNEISEAIWGLTARQVTLAIQIARNPGIWNGHVAPILLRCMIDAHITLAWITGEPHQRCKDYIRFGLGQEKLYLEYLEKEIDEDAKEEHDETVQKVIEIRREWLSGQLMEWAIEVNVGSWSGKSVRDMAVEANCESLYKFAYVPFSGPVHNMWQHVGMYNVVSCGNPLHKFHRIPIITELRLDPDYLYRSAKYISKTFALLSEKMNLVSEILSPEEYFVRHHPFGAGTADS